MRGELAIWFWLAWSAFALLFPHTAALDFLEDASVVRWMAIPLFIACALMLLDGYKIIRISI